MRSPKGPFFEGELVAAQCQNALRRWVLSVMGGPPHRGHVTPSIKSHSVLGCSPWRSRIASASLLLVAVTSVGCSGGDPSSQVTEHIEDSTAASNKITANGTKDLDFEHLIPKSDVHYCGQTLINAGYSTGIISNALYVLDKNECYVDNPTAIYFCFLWGIVHWGGLQLHSTGTCPNFCTDSKDGKATCKDKDGNDEAMISGTTTPTNTVMPKKSEVQNMMSQQQGCPMEKDPGKAGCGNDAVTIASSDITDNGTSIGTVELRWSDSCQSNWARVSLNTGGTINSLKLSVKAASNEVSNTLTVDSQNTIYYSDMVCAPKDCAGAKAEIDGVSAVVNQTYTDKTQTTTCNRVYLQ